jgi:hypothetical protein
MFRGETRGGTTWALAAGAAAGAGAVAFAVLRGVRSLRRRDAHESRAAGHVAELDALEDAAVELLRGHSDTGSCAIDVAAIAPGIVELSGFVPTHEVGQRAARLLHALPGVRTVVSRLEVGSYEARLADARGRRMSGEPETLERQWYGVRVGTGRRRQSPSTDPARTDDSRHRLTRELEVRDDDLLDDDALHPPGDAHETTDRPL